jgi:sec-independent protein translocase protein TatB
MFDIGFSELLVIAVVALIVIGPERLPKVARTAGILLGRVRRYAADVKEDIHREIQLDELRRMMQQVYERVTAADNAVRRELSEVEQTVRQTIAPPPPDSAPNTDPVATDAVSSAPTSAVEPSVAPPLQASATDDQQTKSA